MSPQRESKIFAGDRLRRLRVSRGMAQAELARAIRVSPSYVSQLEADLRPIPSALRGRIAAQFGVAESYFADDDGERLAASLREATGDPLFAQPTVGVEEARAAVRASPDVVERFLTLYRAYLALDQRFKTERINGLTYDSAAGSPAFAYDEVRDWMQSHYNYFDALDRAAERLAEQENFCSATLREDLARYLRSRHDITIQELPTLLAEGTMWRLRRDTQTLSLAGEAPIASRTFWIAHVIGLLDQRALIMRIMRGSGLSTTESRALARIALANYFAGALLMPYGRFLQEAQILRYDIRRIQTRFGTSFEQVCHRLSTMQRRGTPGIPFFFVKTDVAGNVLKRSNATRFNFTHYGGPCPLCNVYRAFAQPGQLLAHVAQTPDGISYLSVARTVGHEASDYLTRPRNVAIVIGCDIEYADQTIYAAGLNLRDPQTAVPVGPGCRACERLSCRHRALPPANQALDLGTEVRGVVPYRIRS
jgi:predicted transcriptional regulator/transcriptional regulator with XRE-family HTH domain